MGEEETRCFGKNFENGGWRLSKNQLSVGRAFPRHPRLHSSNPHFRWWQCTRWARCWALGHTENQTGNYPRRTGNALRRGRLDLREAPRRREGRDGVTPQGFRLLRMVTASSPSRPNLDSDSAGRKREVGWQPMFPDPPWVPSPLPSRGCYLRGKSAAAQGPNLLAPGYSPYSNQAPGPRPVPTSASSLPALVQFLSGPQARWSQKPDLKGTKGNEGKCLRFTVCRAMTLP